MAAYYPCIKTTAFLKPDIVNSCGRTVPPQSPPQNLRTHDDESRSLLSAVAPQRVIFGNGAAGRVGDKTFDLGQRLRASSIHAIVTRPTGVSTSHPSVTQA